MEEARGRPILVDGLVISKWGLPVFTAMHEGGITAANCTCNRVWDGLLPSIEALAQWTYWFREYSHLLRRIGSVDDIGRARQEGRVGIILGWQNSSGFGDDLRMVPLFHELGLRVVQLTYHTANSVGSGCLETRDQGLTDFGRDLISELNRTGILIDLSHVGSITAQQAIEASRRPVAYTHCAPRALKEHPRNKSDLELRHIADHGGFVGVTMFPPFMPKGNESTLDDYLAAIEHVIDLCGEEGVGIGSDFTQGLTTDDISYLLHDKGNGRELLPTPSEILNPLGLRTLSEYSNLPVAMERRGWATARIERVLGTNWVRILGEVWR